jgi:hypothetical protein
MYEVVCGEDVFSADSWAEIREIWEECVFALGAEDVEILIRFVE